MKSLTWVVAAALLAASPAAADHPSSWPQGSAGYYAEHLEAEGQSLRADLERQDAILLALVAQSKDERLTTALSAQEAAWKRYVADECALIGALSDGAGPWRSNKAGECENNLTDQRLRRVRSAARCLRRLPAAERALGQAACLYQLAPMAVPLKP